MGLLAWQVPAKSGFSIMAVVLVAILAFLLGHYASSLSGEGAAAGIGSAAITDAVKKVNATLAGDAGL